MIFWGFTAVIRHHENKHPGGRGGRVDLEAGYDAEAMGVLLTGLLHLFGSAHDHSPKTTSPEVALPM